MKNLSLKFFSNMQRENVMLYIMLSKYSLAFFFKIVFLATLCFIGYQMFDMAFELT